LKIKYFQESNTNISWD